VSHQDVLIYPTLTFAPVAAATVAVGVTTDGPFVSSASLTWAAAYTDNGNGTWTSATPTDNGDGTWAA
jgi:hypothetical protein